VSKPRTRKYCKKFREGPLEWYQVWRAKARGVGHDNVKGKETSTGHGMVQVFKILSKHDTVEKNQWFTMAASSTVNTTQATGPRNLVKPSSNLEVRANFFSIRVVDDWNAILADIQMAKTQVNLRKCAGPTDEAAGGLEVP
jgi:hypothetical protein